MEKIEKFMREQRLQWIGHRGRMDKVKATVKAKNIVVEGSKKRQAKENVEKGDSKRHAGKGDIKN